MSSKIKASLARKPKKSSPTNTTNKINEETSSSSIMTQTSSYYKTRDSKTKSPSGTANTSIESFIRKYSATDSLIKPKSGKDISELTKVAKIIAKKDKPEEKDTEDVQKSSQQPSANTSKVDDTKANDNVVVSKKVAATTTKNIKTSSINTHTYTPRNPKCIRIPYPIATQTIIIDLKNNKRNKLAAPQYTFKPETNKGPAISSLLYKRNLRNNSTSSDTKSESSGTNNKIQRPPWLIALLQKSSAKVKNQILLDKPGTTSPNADQASNPTTTETLSREQGTPPLKPGPCIDTCSQRRRTLHTPPSTNETVLELSKSLNDLLQQGELKIQEDSTLIDEVTDYLIKHRNTIKDLIRVINESKNLSDFSNAIKCLYQMTVRSHLLEQKTCCNAMDYMEPINFVTLLNSFATIASRFSRHDHFRSLSTDLYVKLTKIINTSCGIRQCYNKMKEINEQTLKALSSLLKQHYRKELELNLLDTFLLICNKKRNCSLLNNSLFFDGLITAYKVTQNLNAVMNILYLITKSKKVMNHIVVNDKVAHLLLNLTDYHGRAPLNKCILTEVLYRMAATDKGVALLSKADNYTKLYDYFIKCKDAEEHHCQIKIYHIINRFKNLVVLENTNLTTNVHLPLRQIENLYPTYDYIIDNIDEEISDDDNDEETSCTYNNNKLIDFIQCNPTANSKKMENILSNLKLHFIEYFDDISLNTQQTQLLQLRILRNKNLPVHLDIYDIINSISRPMYLNEIAFPDSTMLPAESEHKIVARPKLALEHLLQRARPVYVSPTTVPLPKVVFDLDEIYLPSKVFAAPSPKTHMYTPYTNVSITGNSLEFESRFESGNLRKAVQVGKYEYNLILNPDTLTFKSFHWFYFEISNMDTDVKYKLNIISFTKDSPSFNEGMLPVMFSTVGYKLKQIGWRRAEGNITFRSNAVTNKMTTIQCNTLTFTTKFPYKYDHVFIAYHFPYTYSRLMYKLVHCFEVIPFDIYARLNKLCDTVSGSNDLPILTITAKGKGHLGIPINKRPLIILTARAHSGESNSSWVMEGCINELLKETGLDAAHARECFVFKIIPMLNPEGVIHGNARSGFAGNDLNRSWANPSEITCPEVFYTKKLIEYAKKEADLPVGAFIDIHGHTRKKYFFFYGCNPKKSWNNKDRLGEDLTDILEILPRTIQGHNPNIQLSECAYDVVKEREMTARVVMWRELGITQSFTLECSLSEGCNKQLMTPRMLSDIGKSVIDALGELAYETYRSRGSLPSFGLDYTDLDSWKETEKPQEKYARRPPKSFEYFLRTNSSNYSFLDLPYYLE